MLTQCETRLTWDALVAGRAFSIFRIRQTQPPDYVAVDPPLIMLNGLECASKSGLNSKRKAGLENGKTDLSKVTSHRAT